jgi:hypothetical protein
MLCSLARASPLPRIPLTLPLVEPPLANEPVVPRDEAPAKCGAGAGVMNFGVALEDAGGLSTKDVSVVLREMHVRCNYYYKKKGPT